MHIEFRPIDQIKPYPGNPRVNDQAVDAVAPRRVVRRDPAKDATAAPRGPRRPRSASQVTPHVASSR